MGRKRFFVRKNPGKRETVKEWIEMNGADFYRFLRTDEAKGRHFIRLGNDGDSECDEIYMEVTKKKYRAWKSEENRKRYRQKRNQLGQKLISLSDPIGGDDEEELTVEDMIGTDDSETSESAIRRVQVAELDRFIAGLSAEEQRLLEMSYWKRMKQEEIAKVLGIAQPNVHKRLQRIERKLARLMQE